MAEMDNKKTTRQNNIKMNEIIDLKEYKDLIDKRAKRGKTSKEITEEILKNYNQEVDSGGFSLGVENCILSPSSDFEKNVLAILSYSKYTRLLKETKLKENETLVLYRADEKGNHHFVKMLENGMLAEKFKNNSIQKFVDWGILENCEQAVFALKRHNAYHDKSVYLNEIEVKTFEDIVKESILTQENKFKYNNQKFEWKENEEKIEVYKNALINQKRVSKKVADGIKKEIIEQKSINILDNQEVYGYQPKQKLIIENGRIKNIDDIKEKIELEK